MRIKMTETGSLKRFRREGDRSFKRKETERRQSLSRRRRRRWKAWNNRAVY